MLPRRDLPGQAQIPVQVTSTIRNMGYIVSEVYEVFIAVVTVVLLASLFTGAVEGQGRAQQPSAQASSESPGTTDRQIKARLAAKAQRTPAQRKVSSQLLDARRAAVAARRQARGAAPVDELVMVDIRADVTPAVLARIRALRGTVINSVARYRAIRARLPLEAVEKLATLDAIQSIRAADEAVTRDQPTGMPSGARTDAPDAARTRTVNTSEGNVPH